MMTEITPENKTQKLNSDGEDQMLNKSLNNDDIRDSVLTKRLQDTDLKDKVGNN